MRRRFTLRFVVVLALLVVVSAAGAAGVAQEASPTPEESPAPAWEARQACPDPGAVDQTHMVEGADGRFLTVRLVAGSRDVAPWAGAGDAIARVKWGRICIEPDSTIAAEDGGDVLYPSVYVIYVESGELFVSLAPDLAGGGYAYLYDGNDGAEIVAGQRHAQAGDMISMANATATFANEPPDEPATLVAVQVAEPGDVTGCSGNCWLPSCFMPVAQQAPTCADKGPAAD